MDKLMIQLFFIFSLYLASKFRSFSSLPVPANRSLEAAYSASFLCGTASTILAVSDTYLAILQSTGWVVHISLGRCFLLIWLNNNNSPSQLGKLITRTMVWTESPSAAWGSSEKNAFQVHGVISASHRPHHTPMAPLPILSSDRSDGTHRNLSFFFMALSISVMRPIGLCSHCLTFPWNMQIPSRDVNRCLVFDIKPWLVRG